MTSPLSAPITTHGDFSINRLYDAAPADVYALWSDVDAKARWFTGPEGWTLVERSMDLRVGGAEILRGRFRGTGVETLFSARYHVVEPGARLIQVNEMYLGGSHQSVSVASVEFISDLDGTRLRITEQVTFVDGTDGRDGTLARKRATGAQMERIAGLL